MYPTPSVTVTSPTEEPALRRPLHLGIATAAANTAARSAQRPMQQAPIPLQQPPSRVQQKLQRNNGPPSPRNGPSPPLAMNNAPSGHHHPQEHVPQQNQQRGMPMPRQAGPDGIRPFELRGNAAQNQYPQQQQAQSRRPALQVAVPQSAHARPQLPQQQQRHGNPASPFSSSTDTLVGTPYDKNNKYGGNYGNGKPPQNWSPSSSGSSSSHTHNNQHAPPSPAFAAGHPNSPYGHPPPSPSIKNLQLQIPSNDDLSLTAHPDNDRLSPAMPRQGANPRDFWKRFSHVIKENEVKEQLAEKTGGGKGSKSQSEWLDAQAHKQRNYRIWVGVVAFIILAAIAGGVAYHYVSKDKDSANAVTVPTKHGFEGTDAESSTSSEFATPVSVSSAMAAPSAVPAGNIIGTRNIHQNQARGHEEEAQRPVALLAARSAHVRAKRHRNLNHLD